MFTVHNLICVLHFSVGLSNIIQFLLESQVESLSTQLYMVVNTTYFMPSHRQGMT